MRHKDILCYYVSPVNAPIVVQSLLFNEMFDCFDDLRH